MICCSVGSRGFTFIYKKGLVLLEIWPITVKNEICSFNAHNDQLIDTMSIKFLKIFVSTTLRKYKLKFVVLLLK